ncbi:SusD-like protein [Formosa agariphila KMM 3901]|uniref:SusD-like protein n=1 Tax=Formosa agariphila (strain DSM 15362 / KCTC 12365 / LMG 23005 / KMM 3901 / M-2Alg 35-1) TaxID=1347342 RepID=T2KHD6_FORAG|nr:RagB/SusD family nutrient uptake outer membrane protein [Formosa agariphila]CDF78267.1 SusD-like protein [Formosa agariphila KMM 3901]
MKKYISKLILAVFTTTAFVSCTEDVLTDPAPTESVTEEVVFNSREGVEALMSGILRNFRGQFTSTDAAGVNSIYFARVMKGNDVIQANNWFGFDYTNDNREPTYRRTVFNWEFPYYIINQANTLINGVEASEAIPAEDKAQLSAQGKAIRAFMYFQLAMEYQHTYTYDATLPAPPIYLELSLEGKPMSTLQEVYDLIIDDLTYAVANLDDYRLGKSYVNQNVANAILARVYQVTENWSGAKEAAMLAYGGSPSSVLDAASYGNGFSDITNEEWIWAAPQSTDQSNYYWGAPHSMADHYTLSYAATHFNNDFVNLFSATDVRNLFQNAYGVAAEDFRHYVTSKFEFNFDSDFAYIRTPEMILIEAEANYHLGDEATAHDLLFAIQSNRDANAVKSNNTGNALFEEILVERRKELYAETGVEWFDAKRLQRGITRTGNHRVKESASLSANDVRFFLKIPQEEIDANINIDDNINVGR